MAAVALHVRPAGWFVFDIHTDQMMEFTNSNPIVAGEAAGSAFVIRSSVDPQARTCDTRIELTRQCDGDANVAGRSPPTSTGMPMFGPPAGRRIALTACGAEYTHEPG